MYPPDTMGMVVLTPHCVSLDQNNGAKTVKKREKERALNETSTADVTDDSTTDATPNATTGATKCRKRNATTSTAPSARLGYIFSAPPGPLPSIYGAIFSVAVKKYWGRVMTTEDNMLLPVHVT